MVGKETLIPYYLQHSNYAGTSRAQLFTATSNSFISRLPRNKKQASIISFFVAKEFKDESPAGTEICRVL